jgi:hypothetical protein
MTNLGVETAGTTPVQQLSNNSGAGVTMGQSTTDLISFYNATPVAQQANTVPLSTQLVNLGLIASGTHNSGTLTTTIYGQTANEPSATGGDYVMVVYSLPASTLTSAGQGLTIRGSGNYAATTNAKTNKIIWNPTAAVVGSTVSGGTTIATTGALTQSGTGWYLESIVYKSGSNTQISQQTPSSAVGAVNLGAGFPAYPTATDTGAILIAVTGNAATATSDINLNLFTVSGSF